MGKSAPTPPPAPDYVGAAQAQGQANIAAGQQTASLGNPNVTNPYGSQSITYTPTGPNGDMQPNVFQSLNPQAQQTLDAQQRVQTGLANLGEQGMGVAQNVLGQPFQYGGPGIQTSLGMYGQPQTSFGPYNQAQTSLGDYGQAQTSLGNYGQAQTSLGNYGQANDNLDLTGVAKMPVNAGVTGQQAILNRLQPQIAQRDAALRQTLANQGLAAGGEGYTNAMRDENNANNDLYSQAALQGIGLDMSANQQGYNQALQSGQFGNQAQQQNYQQALGAGQFANQGVAQNYGQALGAAQLANQGVAQNYSQALGAGQFANQGAAQNYGQALGASEFANQGIGQGYNQALGAGQFGNTAAAQALQQQLGLYNQPLNQVTALMSGSQIQAPQFQQYQGSNIQAAPIANATAQQGQYQQNLYGQQVAAYNAQMQGLGSALGGAAGMFSFAPISLSDVRLKSNIVRVGTHPLGIGIYDYDIFGQRERGVMAHEVEAVRPSAVITLPSGYKAVNYGALN